MSSPSLSDQITELIRSTSEELTATEVAKRLHRDSGTISSTLIHMVKRGLLTRTTKFNEMSGKRPFYYTLVNREKRRHM